jgi:hypothetical protein
LLNDDERRAWFEERFTPEPNTGCWLWLHRYDKKGYGVTFFGPNRGGQLAHRVVYEFYVGPIPRGMFLCHKCDTPACVNPAHMFVGTVKDNALDMVRKGRVPKGRDTSKKMTPELVRELRQQAAQGVNFHELARRFPISRTSVRTIVRGETWKEVA